MRHCLQITKWVLFGFLFLTHPVAAQERQWTLEASDKEAFLVFGVPETDDVGISFWCEIGPGKISLFVNNGPSNLKPSQTTKILVNLDGKKFSVKAKVTFDQKTFKPSVEGKFSIDDPLLLAAERANTLRVTLAKQTNSYPLVDAEISGLRRTCTGIAVN